ncbi:MAG: TerC family protein [Dongiaceae bacterium]
MLADSEFWVALLQIIWIDIVLSGDNAVVIALACRSLPPRQRRWGIALGAAGAIALRVLIATFIVYVLEVPALKIVGGVLLFWIAIKLLLPEPGDATRAVGGGGGGLFAAMRTVMIADAVMSLDNVIGIAAAADGNPVLIVLGLLISIPFIVTSSALILKLLTRFPILVTAGGALLGYIAGELLVKDPLLVAWVAAEAPFLHFAAPIAGAVAVVVAGHGLARIQAARRRDEIDLVT